MKKLANKKGFTLMEMLIVVAIIAILVAIAIPVMNSSLNKSRVAADAANIRAEYAETMVKFLENGDTAVTSEEIKTTGNNTVGMEIAGTKYTWTANATVTITIAANGTVTITGLTKVTP